MPKSMLGMLPLSAVRGPRDTLEKNLAGDDGQKWLDALNRFLRKENPWPVSTPARPAAILGRRQKVVRPAVDASLCLEAFFQNRAGLVVWSDFKTFILQPALLQQKELSALSTTLSRRSIAVASTDTEIEGKLARNYQFSELEAALLVASMITAQPAGKKGLLFNNGYANLFYTPSCVLCVVWFAGDGKWGVGAYLRVDDRWSVGNQVFSSN